MSANTAVIWTQFQWQIFGGTCNIYHLSCFPRKKYLCAKYRECFLGQRSAFSGNHKEMEGSDSGSQFRPCPSVVHSDLDWWPWMGHMP